MSKSTNVISYSFNFRQGVTNANDFNRQTDADRHTDRQTQTGRHRQTDTDRQTDRHRKRQILGEILQICLQTTTKLIVWVYDIMQTIWQTKFKYFRTVHLQQFLAKYFHRLLLLTDGLVLSLGKPAIYPIAMFLVHFCVCVCVCLCISVCYNRS